jgi:hypothetical protein
MGEQDLKNPAAVTAAPDASHSLIADTHIFAGKVDGNLDDGFWDKTGRTGKVLAEGIGYSGYGLVKAAEENFSHPDELAMKVAGGMAFGSLMKLALPAGGVGKALAGTIMLGYFAKDALSPIASGVSEAWHAKKESQLDTAAQKMGDGLGHFYFDAGVGMVSGMAGEKLTGWGARSVMGGPRYAAFEASKEAFWNSDKSPVGSALNGIARGVDGLTTNIKESLHPSQRIERISDEEAIAKINEVARHVKDERRNNLLYRHGLVEGEPMPVAEGQVAAKLLPDGVNIQKSFEDGGFYKKGTFSDLLDQLTGERPQGPVEQVKVGPIEPPKINLKNDLWQPKPGDQTPTLPDEPVVDHLSIKIPVDQATGAAGGGGAKSPIAELDAANIRKIAGEAGVRQARIDDVTAQIMDLRDDFKAPVTSISDAQRTGALVDPAFDKSRDDILALADKMKTQDHVKEAGMILQLHANAAKQIELGDRDVADLNVLADHMYGMFRGGFRKAGISNSILDGKVPSLVTKSFDQGSGNFTIPAIDKVLRRPVTLFPRNQSDLVGVFGSINWHENLGHDHLFPELLRFPDEFRNDVIVKAVQTAMAKNNIADSTMTLEGQQMPKSEVFAKLLFAQANENTADMIGTAAGGVGTPLSLGVLLQSLRKGGMLETRNVSGSQFEETFEPHGFDRWRVKLSAEVMRQLGKGDPAVNKYADALDLYATQSARPGDNYVIASLDNKGQTLQIPMKEWDAVIPEIVKAQLETPLPSFRTDTGDMKALKDILPDFTSRFKATDSLADRMADSALQGKNTLQGPLDPQTFTKDYDIGQVFTATLVAWSKATAKGADPARSLELLESMSRDLRGLYHETNPHKVPLMPTTLDALQHKPLTVIGQGIARTTGDVIGQQPAFRDWTARRAQLFSGMTGSLAVGDLMDTHKTQQELLGQQGH